MLHGNRVTRGARAAKWALYDNGDPRPSRRGLFMVTAVVLSAFGPYVAAGIRTEQVVVYGMTLLLLPLTLPLLRFSKGMAGVAALWVGYLAIVAAGLLDPPRNISGWPFGNGMSGMDNLLLPLCVMLTVAAILALGGDRERLLRVAATVTAVAMMVNAAAALASSFAGVTWTAFWSSTGDSTAMRALTQGRASGLLNQPAEAGLMYGIAALCAIYLWRDRPRRLVLAVAVLTIGGTLTVSKGFLLVGVPVIVWQFLRSAEGRLARLCGVALVAVAAVVTVQAGVLPRWVGVDHLRRWAPGDRSLVANFSANRFGEDSTLAPVVEAVLDGPVFGGFGGQGLAIAYDNAWVEALVHGGLFGVLLFTAALLVMVRVWWCTPRGHERTLLGGVLLVAIGSAFGIPGFTANRAATVLWVLMALMLARRPTEREPHTTTVMDDSVRSVLPVPRL